MAKKHRLVRPGSIVEDAWLGLGNLDGIEIENHLIGRSREDIEQPGLLEVRIMRNPEYLGFAAKVLLDIDLLPIQSAILQEMWVRPFPMFVASRGYGKSFLMALYATLRCVLVPGTKVVGVGAAFRQAKVIYEYMDTIWKNAPVLRSVCTNASGPRSSVDRCTVVINNSSAIFVPLGSGAKIRGLRANVILSDEFGCLEHNSIVETNKGFVRIDDFDNMDHYILTGDKHHKLEKPAKYIKTPLTDVYEVKLSNGYVIRCSENHEIMTKVGWKQPLQLSNTDYIEQSDNKPVLGDRYIDGLYPKDAWLLGTLVSEGCVTNKSQMSITTTDIDTCMKLVNEYGFKFSVLEAYIDKRNWNCKKAYRLWKYDKELRDKIYDWGLDYVTAHNKKIPHAILKSPEDVIQQFLCGLFDGDGSCFLWNDRDIEGRLGLAYYSVSERLCRDVQFLMYKLGFDGYINNRVSNISDNLQWFVRWNNSCAKDAATYLSVPRFGDSIKNCSLPPSSKNYCWDLDRNKWKVSIVYCGKTIQKRFKKEDDAKNFVNLIRNKQKYRKVISVTKLEDQQHLYDYYLPVTHSFYAEGHRQHNSIPPSIYETVVRGFAAVEQRPLDGVKAHARKRALETIGKWTAEEEYILKSMGGNQCIISGTADYDFMHFADYWKKYITYIRSEGNPDKIIKLPSGETSTLKDYFEDGIVPEAFDYRNYSIIRIPYELIPKGFMDDRIVAEARASSHKAIFQKEYGAVFPMDSDGFFKRSLIQSCVASEIKPIELSNNKIWYDAAVKGTAGREYVFGVDPAAQSDNFAVTILELWPDHTRIVYGWSTNLKDFQKRKKAGTVADNDYYGFCARKIRNLMKVFPTENIALDAQGGGLAVLEAFHDKNKLEHGEVFLWPTNKILYPDKELPSDIEPGKHMVHMCQFANFEFTSQANHLTRKDFEDKTLLFPQFDPVTLEFACHQDAMTADGLGINKLYDTLEDCVMEIEDLKDELSTIVMSTTGTGAGARDRWDTPETTTTEGKKIRMRKDRYSALMMASYIARSIRRAPEAIEYSVIGGFSHQLAAQDSQKQREQMAAGEMYQGPEWFTNAMNGSGSSIIGHVRKK